MKELNNIRSNQCLDIARNGITVAQIRLSNANREVNAAMHRLQGVMDGLRHLVKRMVPPVSGKIRSDSMGDGEFGAPRGVRTHTDLDLECTIDEPVLAPHDSHATRLFWPYKEDKRFCGVELVSEYFISQIMYFAPLKDLVGKDVLAGDVLGTAQNVQDRYGPKMTRHIGWRLFINPVIFLEV